jgi:hypothetical protein
VDKELKVFPLTGQSNMAGRGRIDFSAFGNERVRRLRDGRWIVAEEPLHDDMPDLPGIGPGTSLAVELAERPVFPPPSILFPAPSAEPRSAGSRDALSQPFV